ncbi:tellurite resistance protein TerY [Helicobacter pylori]|uniref:vWA domain-containing protein n=1 Tax=Helicobacter pylori TaxID=210 RepID=UPI001AA1E954|nr:tellurite resistance protein TerY [Helicobacter pylori]UOR66826.1 tellurite resistance protein TerY [Helicobacter pylori]GHS21084.1 tellurite resistance protein TerY [Helicobacter pylori]
MALDSSKYTMEERFIPVFLLLDTSGSMNVSLGNRTRIEVLNLCIQKMIETLKQEAKKGSFSEMAIITFGENGAVLHTPFDDIKNINLIDQAFRLAKDLIEDKDTFPTKFYRPYSILVSDGEPNDDKWEKPLFNFHHDGRRTKSVCWSIFIGNRNDNPQVNKDFGKDGVFYADDVEKLVGLFEIMTQTISKGSTSIKDDLASMMDDLK